MADKDKAKAEQMDDKASITLEPEQYRSMILAKLRSDIAEKQALLAEASIAGVDDMMLMSYWKHGYWKHGYWKMGHVIDKTLKE